MTVKTRNRQAHARDGLRPFGRVTKRTVETTRGFRSDQIGMPLGPDGLVFYTGQIKETLRVGDYTLILSERLPADNRPDDPIRDVWEAYVDLPDSPACRIGHIHATLDEALLHAISFRHQYVNYGSSEAMNTRVPELFWRMVGGREEEEGER